MINQIQSSKIMKHHLDRKAIWQGIPDNMVDCSFSSLDCDVYREARDHMFRFGTLLRLWPDIFTIARKLRASGYDAANPW